MVVRAITCIDNRGGIGKDGGIPWSLPPDMRFFRTKTLHTTIIMGARTWASIGAKPLRGRTNVVITSSPESIQGALVYGSLSDAIAAATGDVFVIGGSRVYEESLKYAQTIFVTRIYADFDCDTMFPIERVKRNFALSERSTIREHNGLEYAFEIYERI